MWWLLIQSAQANTFMPPAATAIAEQVDSLYAFLLWASFISCVLVIGGFVYFALKYKRKSEADKTAYISHNNFLEFLWSFIPFVIFMGVFVWGWVIYSQMRSFPEDALEVSVLGQKWNWAFEYKNGRKSAGVLVVPENTPIKLVMTSKDVLHSFYIPAFRVKQDLIPGRYTALWFNSKYKGEFQIFCTEYCGDQHSGMLATAKVVSREEFDEWLGNDPYKGLAMDEIGQKIYATRCAVCHQTSDQRLVGPGFKGLFGKEHMMESGEMVVADENYIRESILNPNAKIVKGYPKGQMPTFAGQLDEQEIMGIIEYIKTLK